MTTTANPARAGLDPQRRTVVTDVRGHGVLGHDEADFDSTTVVDDLLATFEARAIERVVPVTLAHGPGPPRLRRGDAPVRLPTLEPGRPRDQRRVRPGITPRRDRLTRGCPTLHTYAQPADPAYLAVQQEFAGIHPWFHVRRLDAVSHFPTLEVPGTMAREIEEFVCSLA